jgi:hypothetical protein
MAPLADRPRYPRIGHAGDDDLTAHLAQHSLSDAKAWRPVRAEQTEAIGVFHRAAVLVAVKS